MGLNLLPPDIGVITRPQPGSARQPPSLGGCLRAQWGQARTCVVDPPLGQFTSLTYPHQQNRECAERRSLTSQSSRGEVYSCGEKNAGGQMTGPFRLLARLLPPFALGATAVLLACRPIPVSVAPAATATPTVSPNVEAVVKAIEADRLAARAILTAFLASEEPVITGTQFAQLSSDAAGSCSDLTQHVSARRGLAKDLWPAAYERLHDEVSGSCYLYNLKMSMSDRDKWSTAALVHQKDLQAALDGLPDYSPAQLRRAIAERE